MEKLTELQMMQEEERRVKLIDEMFGDMWYYLYDDKRCVVGTHRFTLYDISFDADCKIWFEDYCNFEIEVTSIEDNSMLSMLEYQVVLWQILHEIYDDSISVENGLSYSDGNVYQFRFEYKVEYSYQSE